jgi:predicted RNA-binding Zn-ribbon protein involved in translation (DUF1610 family)
MPKTFECPKCGERRTERLASQVEHPCKQNNRYMTRFKEVEPEEHDE